MVIAVARETLAARPVRVAALAEGAVTQGASSKRPIFLDGF